MRCVITIAALAAATLPLAPAAAQSIHGYAASAARNHTGPLREYPGLRTVRRGAMIDVHGCLRDWSWCDVTSGSDRGWIAGNALRVVHKGRRRAIGAGMGVGVTTFSFGSYWDNHYMGRRFYGERQRWQEQSDRAYRPAWGKREQRNDKDLPSKSPEMEEQHRRAGERGERTGGPVIKPYMGAPYRFPDHATADEQSDHLRFVPGTETATSNPHNAGTAPAPD